MDTIEKLTVQDYETLTKFLKTTNGKIIKRLLSLYFIIAFTFLFLIFKRGGSFSLSSFIYGIVVPAVIINVGLYFYVAPYNIKKDIKNGVKRKVNLKVNSIEKIQEAIAFDFIIIFESNPYIKKYPIISAIKPEMLNATTFDCEITQISKSILKIESSLG